MGWVIGIAAFSPFVLCLDFSSPQKTLSDVTGRVTYSGRPLNDTIICLDSDGVHSAFSTPNPDGSFRLLSMTEYRVGAFEAGITLIFTLLWTARHSPPSMVIPSLREWRSRSTRIGAN